MWLSLAIGYGGDDNPVGAGHLEAVHFQLNDVWLDVSDREVAQSTGKLLGIVTDHRSQRRRSLLVIGFHADDDMTSSRICESHEISQPICFIPVQSVRGLVKQFGFELKEQILRCLLLNKIQDVSWRNLTDQLSPNRHVRIIPNVCGF